MPRNKRIRDPLPESFKTVNEFAKFWDSHSVSDYPEAFREVGTKVTVRRRRHYGVTLDTKIAAQLAKRAQAEGKSLDMLVNQMLADHMHHAV
jgi:predicted HicB family RNase H-like nuclease